MKIVVTLMLVFLMVFGCGEEAKKEALQEEAKDDPSVPLAIPCVACGEKVSKKTKECRQCGHPTPDSVVAYKEAQELARIMEEKERERQMEIRIKEMEESRLFAIKAEEERKLAAIKAEEERKLAAIKAEEERKRQELMTKRVKSLLEKNENFVTDNQLEMLWVKPGSFMMGTVSEHDDASQHKVTLTKGFYLGKYEVTQAQYEAVRKWNPSNFKGADRPVDYVNWNDAVDFCEVLTEMEKKAGRVPEGMSYQLPTEAQWEYACRAGTTGKFSWGSKVREHNANYHRNVGETTPVGKYPANPWGFHDMQGNVSEWCADWYFEDYPLGRSPVTDPTGHPTGIISKYRDQSRVMRGGDYKTDLSWGNSGSAQRNYSEPDTRLEMFGFRVCLF